MTVKNTKFVSQLHSVQYLACGKSTVALKDSTLTRLQPHAWRPKTQAATVRLFTVSCCFDYLILTNTLLFKTLEKCAEKERISDENCVFFKECKNGTYSLFKCPRILSPEGSWSNQMFDPTSKKCINKQKLAIKGDCHAYKECVSIGPAFSIEYWRKASCPTSMHFSAATGVCLKTIESTCCKLILNK